MSDRPTYTYNLGPVRADKDSGGRTYVTATVID